MMVLAVVLQEMGFYSYLAVKTLGLVRTPWRLMVVAVVTTAALSAFLVNDAVVLVFTPVLLLTCRLRRVNPVPYLIGEAMAANIGSVATIVGNPQNMLVGTFSGIPFWRFFAHLLPVAIVSVVVLLAVLYLFYRRELRPGFSNTAPHTMALAVSLPMPRVSFHRRLKWVVLLVAFMGLSFFLSSLLRVTVPMIALAGGILVLLVSGLETSVVLRKIDWPLLLFFAGLFIVVGGAREAGVVSRFLSPISLDPGTGGIFSLHFWGGVLSQVVSNVPLTMLLIPVLEKIPGDVLWISLAAGTTLGGNITLIGAVANLIVAEGAIREGVEVKFSHFFKIGIVVGGLTLLLSALILTLEFYLDWLH